MQEIGRKKGGGTCFFAISGLINKIIVDYFARANGYSYLCGKELKISYPDEHPKTKPDRLGGIS